MSSLIQVQKVNMSYGSKLLFKNATFAVNEGEHIGVLGPNGAGKSTLFKILTQQEDRFEGKVIKSSNLRLGYLAQHDEWDKNETLESYLEKEIILPIWDIKQLGIGLGFKDEDYTKKVLSFSGGYRMRLKLLSMLGKDPNLILLDEPTNYLDLETLLVLEDFLINYKGAFLLISHDREFLKKTTNQILEVDVGRVVKFSSPLETYLEQKSIWREEQEKKAESINAQKKEIEDFAARFRAKASKAVQVQSRLKKLEKLEDVELIPFSKRPIIRIPKPEPMGKMALEVSQVNLGYEDVTVLKDIELMIFKRDHIGIVGLNGAGKSTLLKGLSGDLTPQKGEVRYGHNLKIGYYAQHVIEALPMNTKVYDAVEEKAIRGIARQEIVDLLGALMFQGGEVEKSLSVLSGGELARVALARILVQKNNCLILDEPTNHLDFDTVEVLTESLKWFEGSLIVVSHDRNFIGQISKKILEISDGKVLLYPGTYNEYVWSLNRGALSDRDPSVSIEEKNNTGSKKKPKFNYKNERKSIEKSIRQVSKNIEEIESHLEKESVKIKELTEKIEEGDSSDILKWSNKLKISQEKVSELERLWDQNTEKLSKLERDLNLLLSN